MPDGGNGIDNDSVLSVSESRYSKFHCSMLEGAIVTNIGVPCIVHNVDVITAIACRNAHTVIIHLMMLYTYNNNNDCIHKRRW